jgi:hypothetical protein
MKLQKMYQKISLWSKGGRYLGLTKLTASICRLSRNLGASVFWKPQSLSRHEERLLYFPKILSKEAQINERVWREFKKSSDIAFLRTASDCAAP